MKGYLDEVPKNEIASATDKQYPAVAALGYTVSALCEWWEPFDEDEEYFYAKQRDSITRSIKAGNYFGIY